MSKHKFYRDAPGDGPKPKRDMVARAKIIEKYGVKMQNCTALNCHVIGELMDKKQHLEFQNRWKEAGEVWKDIQAHERGPECGQAVTK